MWHDMYEGSAKKPSPTWPILQGEAYKFLLSSMGGETCDNSIA
jgi:hypothetical protein